MTDIVERLRARKSSWLEVIPIMEQAADEIERLRNKTWELDAVIEDYSEKLAKASHPLPSLNWKDGKPYSYCPECGRVENVSEAQ